MDIEGGLGQWIAGGDQLDQERVEVGTGEFASQTQDLSIGRTTIRASDLVGSDVKVPLLFFAILDPEGGLDRYVLIQSTHEFRPRVDLFAHQLTLIHLSTPFAGSVTASKSSRASTSVFCS